MCGGFYWLEEWIMEGLESFRLMKTIFLPDELLLSL